MKETLETINRMQADGIIGQYAIGGAVGATFYLEPAATLDVDIFVMLPEVSESSLVSLSPIYEFLASHGYKLEGEHVIIGTWPVQFLTPGNALEREALFEAVQTDAGAVPTWVMTAEHLVAIALQTGRSKDYARIINFLEHRAVNRNRLDGILARHGLTTKWKMFKKRYLE
ncbi:MAG TPA: hypothetical protein VI685_16360 [Candidatus Angelobacter sp.]